jgi:hypothetical protein
MQRENGQLKFLIGQNLDSVVGFNWPKFWIAKMGYLLSLSGKS